MMEKMIEENPFARAHVEHRASGMEVIEIAGDHAVAGELVRGPHEGPAAGSVLLLPRLARDRRVTPAGLMLPGADAALQPVREGEPAAVEKTVVDDVDQLEGAPAKRSEHLPPSEEGILPHGELHNLCCIPPTSPFKIAGRRFWITLSMAKRRNQSTTQNRSTFVDAGLHVSGLRVLGKPRTMLR